MTDGFTCVVVRCDYSSNAGNGEGMGWAIGEGLLRLQTVLHTAWLLDKISYYY